MASDVLRVTQLSKRYRGRRGVQANDGIDLDIAPGQVVGLLGHNGAGKTTLVNQIVGLVRPDSGRIEVGGVDAVARPDAARRLVSVQAQANVPISGLSPRRAVELVGRIRGADAEATRRRTSALLDALDLDAWADTPAEKVSGGIARLTAFAMTAVAPGASFTSAGSNDRAERRRSSVRSLARTSETKPSFPALSATFAHSGSRHAVTPLEASAEMP